MNTELMAYVPWLAVLAPIGLFWSQIKIAITKIFNIFVIKVELQEEIAIAFSQYVLENCKRFPLGSWVYDGTKIFSKIDKKRIKVGYEHLNKSPQIFKIEKTFIFASDTKGNDKENNTFYRKRINLYYIRGTFKHEEFLIKCLDNINQNIKNNRFKIEIKYGLGKRQFITTKLNNDYSEPPIKDTEKEFLENHNRVLKYNMGDLGSNEDISNIFKGYVFCDNANKLLKECKQWLGAKNWYDDHGLNWKRGFLIYGKPGTGKTSLVRKICQVIDIPLFIFDLASMSNSEFIENWKEIQSQTPCAVIFDDIDKIFDKKENISGTEGGGLTFDCFLSGLSGALPIQGVLTFATANDTDKVDEALGCTKDGLISRPGRIDSIIEIGLMERKNREQLSELILGYKDENLIDSGEGFTAAQFSDILTQKALTEFWNTKHSK